jgi:hypothetical protein
MKMTNKTRKEVRQNKDQTIEIKEKFKKLGQDVANKTSEAKILIQEETVKSYNKLKKEASMKMENRKRQKEENEKRLLTEKEKKLEREKNIMCEVGSSIHQQKTDYGKGTTDFYFGGYLNDHTISIVVENIMGARTYSSNYYIQVKIGTKFKLPGLFNDKTGEFKYVELEIKKMDISINSIKFEKHFK